MYDQCDSYPFLKAVLYRIREGTIVTENMTEHQVAIRVGWFDDLDSYLKALNAIPFPEGMISYHGVPDIDSFPERKILPITRRAR